MLRLQPAIVPPVRKRNYCLVIFFLYMVKDEENINEELDNGMFG